MLKLRTLLSTLSVTAFGIFCLAPLAANAQSTTANAVKEFTPLARFVSSTAVNRTARYQDPANPFSNFSFHLGGMVSPRGAALVGGDVDIVSLSLGNGWHGRLDADAIIKANLGGVDTIVPVTFDQVYYSPNAAGGHNVYYGGGLGAVFGGGTTFDGKLILGTELTNRIGAEVNLHFTEHDTLVTLFARIHL